MSARTRREKAQAAAESQGAPESPTEVAERKQVESLGITPAQEPVKAQDSAPATVLTDIAGQKPVRDRKNRQTGTQIQLFKPVAPGTTHVVVCVDHRTIRHYPTRKAAKASVYVPASWCPGCGEKLELLKAEAARKAQEALTKAKEAAEVKVADSQVTAAAAQ